MAERTKYPETVVAACANDDCYLAEPRIVGGRIAAEGLKRVHEQEEIFGSDGKPEVHGVGYIVYWADSSLNPLRSN